MTDGRPWPFGDLGMMRYECIVADPPWSFNLRSEAGERKSPMFHYDCMSVDDIAALPVEQLARGDCLLLLWTCGWAMANRHAHRVAMGWGFTPITELVWRKTTKNGKVRMGPGYRARTMHEPILLCTMGNPIHGAFPSLFDGLARRHSEKPDEFYEMVRGKTKHMLHRADLFSAGIQRSGFEGWGEDHRGDEK